MDPTLPGVLIGLAVAALIFGSLERIFGRGRGRPWFRRAWLTDLTYGVMTALITKPLTRLVIIAPAALLLLAGATTVETLRSGGYAGFGPLSRQPLWLQAVEIFLVVDFTGYWMHRLFHRGRLWRFHAVHHSSEELDWLASLRVHPVNELVNKLVSVTPVLLLGYSPLVSLGVAPLLTFYALLLHANVDWDFGPLRGVIASPAFHRWHHSREPEAMDKNFAGLLPLWDRLFGTYYLPAGRRPRDFGIDETMPANYLAQLWRPFAPGIGQPGGRGLPTSQGGSR